jgi:hypothetical protein
MTAARPCPGHRLGVLLHEVRTFDRDAVTHPVDSDDLAVAPLSLPAMTMNFVALFDLHLQHLRRKRDDAHELLLAQLTADRAEDTGSARVPAVLDQNSGVLVETM